MFVGGLNGTFNSAEGEGHDRTSLELLGFQHELIHFLEFAVDV